MSAREYNPFRKAERNGARQTSDADIRKALAAKGTRVIEYCEGCHQMHLGEPADVAEHRRACEAQRRG